MVIDFRNYYFKFYFTAVSNQIAKTIVKKIKKQHLKVLFCFQQFDAALEKLSLIIKN